MAHAKIENNKVVNVIATSNDNDISKFEGLFVSLDKFPNAVIGDDYDPISKEIYSAKPFASWTLNKNTYVWEAPLPYPKSEYLHTWNEKLGKWEKIVDQS